MHLIPYGIIIGLIIGPIAVSCVRQSMIAGFLMGIATGLGASSTHIIFGSIAAFGLTAVILATFGTIDVATTLYTFLS